MIDTFQARHLGPREADVARMLEAIGAPSVDALIAEIVPADIRATKPLDLPAAESEAGYHRRLRALAAENRVFRSYIGLGYHDTITPAVDRAERVRESRLVHAVHAVSGRNRAGPARVAPEFPDDGDRSHGDGDRERVAARRSDGRGRSDDAAAPREASGGCADVPRVRPRVSARAGGAREPRGTARHQAPRHGSVSRAEFTPDVFGVYVQSPDDHGEVLDLKPLVERAHAAGALVAVGTDLLALTLMTPPGEAGADVVVGNAQRFGVPLGYGGPHAAFFATREKFVRQAPGRIIGVSVDSKGRRAFRMALQTREQHIRREKATSNICTAQALLANMAAFYAVYHGPDGLKEIGARVHDQAGRLAAAISALGWKQTNGAYFDTLRFEGEASRVSKVRTAAEIRGINLRYPAPGVVQISLNETVTESDLPDRAVSVRRDGHRDRSARRDRPRLLSPAACAGRPGSWRIRCSTRITPRPR